MNSPASVRARLLNLSEQSVEDFQAVLTRYAIKRFLFRLGRSGQKNEFALKGDIVRCVAGLLTLPHKRIGFLWFRARQPRGGCPARA
jgi:hypothetical protein